MLKVTLRSDHAQLQRFRHFWCKIVRGFNPTVHCINTLVGERVWEVTPKLATNADLIIRCKEGDFVYFCGVAEDWNWSKNFHLVGRVTRGAIAQEKFFTGDELIVNGMERIEIVPDTAATDFQHLGPKFTTCRNFQFAACAAKLGWIPTMEGPPQRDRKQPDREGRRLFP